MKKQNLSHYFEWVSAAISPFPWQCSDLYVMENQQRGKFTEKQNKANKTNNASSKTAKTVLLWWIHSKWKHPRTKDIVNTFQKKMDKGRQKFKESIMSDFRFNQRPKEDPSKKSCGQRWDLAPTGGVVRNPNFFLQIHRDKFCLGMWQYTQTTNIRKWNCVKVTYAFKLNYELNAQMKCLCAFNSTVPAIWIFSQRCKVVKGSAKLK